MKKYLLILLAVLLTVCLTACIKVEIVTPGAKEEPVKEVVQEEVVQESSVQEETVEEAPVEGQVTESTPATAEEELWKNCIGVWSSAPGVQTDPVAQYHNYYVCLFENGTCVRFGWRLMDVAETTVYGNMITTMGGASCSSGAGEGWTANGPADWVTYEFDKDKYILRVIESVEEDVTGSTDWPKTYYPANRADAYEACARYLSYLDDLTWESGVDNLIQKTETDELIPKVKEGLRQISGMPSQTKHYTDVDLTKGYWYMFNPQSADCSEYRFHDDGTVIIRGRDVMNGTGEYQDILHPNEEMYAIREQAYTVTQTGNVIIGSTEMVMAPTFGQLLYSFTETWSEGKVFSGYLKQFDHKLSVEEMREEGGYFAWDFWNSNVITLDE